MSSFGTKLNRQGACARVQCTVHSILPTGRKIGLHSYNYSLPIHQKHPLKQHPKHSTSSQTFIYSVHISCTHENKSLCFSVFTSLPKNRATKSHNRMDRRVVSKLVVNLWLVVELSEAECYCFVFFLCTEYVSPSRFLGERRQANALAPFLRDGIQVKKQKLF